MATKEYKVKIIVLPHAHVIAVNGMRLTPKQFREWANQVSKGEIVDTGVGVPLIENQAEEGGLSKLYLMVDHNTGLYKIGISNNPKVREKTLQSEKPTIELVKTWPGTMAEEKALHRRFARKRVRGEWFKLTEEDVKFIQAL